MTMQDFLLANRLPIFVVGAGLIAGLAALGWILWRRLRKDLLRVYQTMAELRSDESRYRFLIENSLQGILIRRGDRPLFVNQAFADIFGYANPAEVLALSSTRMFLFPEDRAVAGEGDRTLMESGGSAQEPVRRKRKDGRTVWLEMTGRPVMWEGEPAVQSVMIDVTGRHDAETALRNSEMRFRRLIEESNQGVHVHRNGKTLYVNRAFARIYGYSDPQEFLALGSSFAHVLPEERESTRSAETSILAGETPSMHVEAQRRRKDGTLIWVETHRTRVDWEGESAVLSTIIDITERHEAEAALRAGERRFRTLIEDAPQAMHIRRGGRSLFVNRAFARIYGFGSPEEFLAQVEPLGHVPPALREELLREDNAILTGESPFVQAQVLRHKKNGTPIWIEVNRRRVEWEGRPAVLATSVDITERYSAEAALRESEQRFRAMIDTIPAPIAITHMSDGRFLFVNPQFEQLMGASAAHLLGQRGALFCAEKKDVRMVDETVHGVGSMPPTEIQFRRVDGTLFWALLAARAFAYKGEPAVLVALSDVTARKAMEEALRESEQRLRTIIETVPVPVAIIRSADAKFVFANPQLEQALGLTADELYGRINFEFYVDRADGVRNRKRLAESGELPPQEFRLRRADGTPFWALVSARNFTYRGEPAILAVLNDVSERRAMEEALRESREHLRTVVNNSPLILFAIDGTGAVTLLEGKPLEWVGLAPAHALNQPFEVAFDQIPQLVADLRSARYGRAFRSVVEAQNLAFEFWYQPLFDGEGVLAGVIGVGTDITELKAREQDLIQAQKMEAVGQLTGGVAHDFNNLLTIILGNSELLEMGLSDAQRDLHRQVDLIRNAALRGAELAQRLLAFSRRQPLQPKPVAMDRFLNDMATLLRRTLGEHITIGISVPPAAWQPVVDHSQLGNALINLAVNARDAMPDGGMLGIEVTHLPKQHALRSELDLSPNDYVVLRVTDTGTGMAPDVRARAFDPFFTTKDVGKGSGLGLSMVYGFAKQSGGLVRIESEPGKGTTVLLYLPRAMGHDAQKALPVSEPARPTGTETILVVEDDAGVREFAVRLLKELGYRVTAAETAQEALDLMERMGAPDLLFSDVILPGAMSGEQLAAQVKSRQPAVRILFTSGYTSNHLMKAGRLPNGVYLLDKPYKSQQLAAMVRRVLDQMV
jgi:PAS domain S-box-containing protein